MNRRSAGDGSEIKTRPTGRLEQARGDDELAGETSERSALIAQGQDARTGLRQRAAAEKLSGVIKLERSPGSDIDGASARADLDEVIIGGGSGARIKDPDGGHIKPATVSQSNRLRRRAGHRGGTPIAIGVHPVAAAVDDDVTGKRVGGARKRDDARPLDGQGCVRRRYGLIAIGDSSAQHAAQREQRTGVGHGPCLGRADNHRGVDGNGSRGSCLDVDAVRGSRRLEREDAGSSRTQGERADGTTVRLIIQDKTVDGKGHVERRLDRGKTGRSGRGREDDRGGRTGNDRRSQGTGRIGGPVAQARELRGERAPAGIALASAPIQGVDGARGHQVHRRGRDISVKDITTRKRKGVGGSVETAGSLEQTVSTERQAEVGDIEVDGARRGRRTRRREAVVNGARADFQTQGGDARTGPEADGPAAEVEALGDGVDEIEGSTTGNS